MKVSVLTSQNVEIEYEVASIGDRVVAAMIDGLILTAVFIGFVLISIVFAGAEDVVTILGMLLTMGVVLYPLLCEVFMQGQTFGKRMKKIRVVKLDGTEPTFGSYLLRWLLGLVERGGIGLIVLFINGKGQRLGDMAAGTTVIRMDDRESFHDTIHVRIEEGYTPMFPEVTKLTEKDIATIKEVVDDCVNSDNMAALAVLARKVKELLGVESNLPPYGFLGRVLKDYNYYMGKV